MKVNILTKKGTNKKSNTDCLLFVSEGTQSNPVIIDSQDFYSHYLDVDSSFLAVMSDGMGGDASATMASKKVVQIFQEHFHKLINTISEQEIMYTISDLFVRIELAIAKESSENENYIGASAGLAGILYNEAVGFFVFNSGDVRVYKKEEDGEIASITKDHVYNDVVENFAGGGGRHYISTVGAMRKIPTYHFIATQGFYDNVSNQDIEKILKNNDSQIVINEMKDKLENMPNNSSIIHILY